MSGLEGWMGYPRCDRCKVWRGGWEIPGAYSCQVWKGGWDIQGAIDVRFGGVDGISKVQ